MRKNVLIARGEHDPGGETSVIMEEMKAYCEEHPRSPAAVRRPRLFIRGRTVVALLGPTLEEGIAGFGDTFRAVLRAFDAQYQHALRPPTEAA